MAAIQSLQRAFDILRAVSVDHDGASLTEIARRAALPKSTVSRMLTTLEGIGAVERLSHADGYRIGDEIVTLAAQVAYPRSLIAIARPYLQELAQNSGETISLGTPDGDASKTIDQIDSRSELQVRNWVGKRLPLYCTSDGKLFLAEWSDVALIEYLRRPFEAYTENTIIDPTELRRELAQIRTQGYAWNRRERDPDLVSIAAPIRNETGKIVAAVCMFGPFFRFPSAEKETEAIHLTLDTAQKIGHRLQVLADRSERNGGDK